LFLLSFEQFALHATSPGQKRRGLLIPAWGGSPGSRRPVDTARDIFLKGDAWRQSLNFRPGV
jgi:hypothetical protein